MDSSPENDNSQYSHPVLGRGGDHTKINGNEGRNGSGPHNLRNSLRGSVVLSPPSIPRRLRRWPRTFACCVGVFIPLNMLVMVSLLFGMLFGKLEMQEEIDHNDAAIRSRMAGEKHSNDLADVLHQLPTLCLALLEKDETIEALPDILENVMTNSSILETYLQFNATSKNQQVIPGNKTVQEMSDFFANCGKAGEVFQDNWLGLFKPMVNEDTSQSFNYIRCVNRSSPLAFNAIISPTAEDIEEARPSTQARLYEESWKKSQKEFELLYLKEYPEVEALTKSYEDATGKEKCSINMPSAGKSDWRIAIFSAGRYLTH